ncbi:hypothetical protein BH23VER1_BH23VER1_06490 [soil metagenome]
MNPSSPDQSQIRVGIVGGGLMGREMASAFARWCALDDPDLPTPILAAVADPSPAARDWFARQIPTATLLAGDYRELLAEAAIDVVYVAVPHHLHAEIYLAVLDAGKDLLAEKPFGIDLEAARAIVAKGEATGRFVRVSSEFPFFPGVQEIVRLASGGEPFFGRILEVSAGFHHASDLDPTKAANWKRQSATCGAIGVMGDLGLHVAHLPARLGWRPSSVYAQLQHGFPERPDGKGGTTACDTFDNATLHTWSAASGDAFPMRLEMKRLAPGATNSWWIEIAGTLGSARFSTSRPKSLHTFRDGEWRTRDLGFTPPVKTITGGIFEFGFPDAIQQMWAAYLLERAGLLGDRFGCATPEEALASHTLFAAALESHNRNTTVRLGP